MRHSGFPPYGKMTPEQREAYWKRFWGWMDRDARVYQRMTTPDPARILQHEAAERAAFHRRSPRTPAE